MPRRSEANAIMQYAFLKVFADDGTIDLDELRFIERLALRDGRVDAEEKDVLRRILARVPEEQLAPEVRDEVRAFRREWEI